MRFVFEGAETFPRASIARRRMTDPNGRRTDLIVTYEPTAPRGIARTGRGTQRMPTRRSTRTRVARTLSAGTLNVTSPNPALRIDGADGGVVSIPVRTAMLGLGTSVESGPIAPTRAAFPR